MTSPIPTGDRLRPTSEISQLSVSTGKLTSLTRSILARINVTSRPARPTTWHPAMAFIDVTCPYACESPRFLPDRGAFNPLLGLVAVAGEDHVEVAATLSDDDRRFANEGVLAGCVPLRTHPYVGVECLAKVIDCGGNLTRLACPLV